MAQELGKELATEEQVHHINGDSFDDRIENLQLFPNASEHIRHHRALRRAARDRLADNSEEVHSDSRHVREDKSRRGDLLECVP